MTDRRVRTALLVPAGMLAGHVLSAVIAHALGLELRGLPHGTVEILGTVALPLAIVAAVRTLGDPRRPVRPGVQRFAVWQVGVYLALFATEQILHGGGLGAVAHEPALWLGVAGQLAGALVASLCSALLTQLHAAIHPRATRHTAPATPVWRAAASPQVRSRVIDSVIRRRGPPTARVC